MEAIKISPVEIIKYVPAIMQFFVSGFIFIVIFNKLCSKKILPTTHTIFSCVISFIFVASINAINSLWIHHKLLEDIWIICFLSLILSCIMAVTLSKIFTSKIYTKFLADNFGISQHDTVWRNVFDLENGTNLKVKLKGTSNYFIGHHFSHEENGADSWFCLKSIIKYDLEGNKIYSQENNKNAYMTFCIKDVETMEIFI